MRYVNLTNKVIRIAYGDAGNPKFREITPSGVSASVIENRVMLNSLEDGMQVEEIEFGGVENLPDPQPGVIYIVNGYVAQAVGADRDDVVAPEIGKSSIRIDGRIYAITRWRVYA